TLRLIGAASSDLGVTIFPITIYHEVVLAVMVPPSVVHTTTCIAVVVIVRMRIDERLRFCAKLTTPPLTGATENAGTNVPVPVIWLTAAKFIVIVPLRIGGTVSATVFSDVSIPRARAPISRGTSTVEPGSG